METIGTFLLGAACSFLMACLYHWRVVRKRRKAVERAQKAEQMDALAFTHESLRRSIAEDLGRPQDASPRAEPASPLPGILATQQRPANTRAGQFSDAQHWSEQG